MKASAPAGRSRLRALILGCLKEQRVSLALSALALLGVVLATWPGRGNIASTSAH